MSSATRNLPMLEGAQAIASDPAAHVWLSASAGTGKTQVLSSRVFRLLLRGVQPGAILCLTFTKAGAAEMAERINGRLARWVRADRASLRADLGALGETPDDALEARARTLFAAVLDAPGGGIRIQTIHGFCQSLLAAFPMEAGLVPGFRPLEGREEAVMAREALAELLVREEALGGSPALDAIAAMSLRLGDGAAEGFLAACARAPDAMEAMPSGIQPWLRRQLDLPADVEAAIAAGCADDAFDIAGLRRAAAANRQWKAATGAKAADMIAAWLAAGPAGRADLLDDLKKVFLTGKNKPLVYSQKLIDADPNYKELAAGLGMAALELVSLRPRAAYADGLAAALEAGREYARAYAAMKRRTGAVDFNDLIRETKRLLAIPGIGEWVRYKLDQATEHVLIDEAQDTNWDQWSIINALVDEFFAGEGARAGVTRTLFTVGDYKQAIFGFQGTSPQNFALAHRRFERLAQVPEGVDPRDWPLPPLNTLSLNHSFRSTEPILKFVDEAIAALPADALGQFSDIEPHGTKIDGPGLVTLWRPDLGGAADDAAEDDDEAWVDEPVRAVAKRIARYVKGWIAAGRGDAGDVMILVRSRGELAALIVARLYAAGVAVAGVDRLRLQSPLAVQDLLAAIRFVLQPDDDLSLASLLVSPLIGCSQDELMEAAPRGRVSLWRHLRDTRAERLGALQDMLAQADFTTPYRFLEHILSGPMDGRRRLIHRLGAEARDPIEELLTAALQFERQATPSLQRFLDWFDRGDVEIKRDAAQQGGAVRVMTAHGAKGLQAPLVILADATSDPRRNLSGRGLFAWRHDPVAPPLPVYRPQQEERGAALSTLIAATEQAEQEEYWRLFYVAATRAERELVIAGSLGASAEGVVPEVSWHAQASRALDALGVAPLGEGQAERSYGTAPPPRPARADAAAGRPELPHWLSQAPAREARPSRPLAPSSLGDDAVADPPPTPAMRVAAERGRMIHALLERLPAVAAEHRAAAADRWLAGAGGLDDADERAAVAGAALGVIADPRFADLFGPDALAEAPIAAVIDGFVVAGTADRLLVQPDRVQVVDFKTGRRAPLGIEEVPPYHLRQMAAYAAALAVIFPGRRIEAALLYTSAARMIPVPADVLAAHKPDFAGMEQS